MASVGDAGHSGFFKIFWVYVGFHPVRDRKSKISVIYLMNFFPAEINIKTRFLLSM